jgi:hypothetical protein
MTSKHAAQGHTAIDFRFTFWQNRRGTATGKPTSDDASKHAAQRPILTIFGLFWGLVNRQTTARQPGIRINKFACVNFQVARQQLRWRDFPLAVLLSTGSRTVTAGYRAAPFQGWSVTPPPRAQHGRVLILTPWLNAAKT